jgi:hypothetical protein
MKPLYIEFVLSLTAVYAFSGPQQQCARSVSLQRFAATASHSNTTNQQRFCRAQELMLYLVNEEQCFTSEKGARAFADACATTVVYEDRFEPQPIIGRTAVAAHMLDKLQQRQGKGNVRIDRISDGDKACGFAWTWTSGNLEGLRGTTFVQLNENTGEINYVQEIPEPIFKPGNLTIELLKAVTAGSDKPSPVAFQRRTPTVANELAKYLFIDLQNAKDGIEELMRFFDDGVIYRDFNFENVLCGPEQVRKFVQDFSFPGITFKPLRFDDGIDSTCFTWYVVHTCLKASIGRGCALLMLVKVLFYVMFCYIFNLFFCLSLLTMDLFTGKLC